jgi:iron complex outermembrane receptor protein
VLEQVELNLSGRYDDYSEGFSHFSPKLGVKYTPIRQLAFRGTYSEGFRAPTFAESGVRSQYAGFVTTTAAGQLRDGARWGEQPVLPVYSMGRGVAGNPDLKPEISRSFTIGAIYEPTRWLSLTVDYYHVKKEPDHLGSEDLRRPATPTTPRRRPPPAAPPSPPSARATRAT